jgi:hypothetical protein
MFYYVLENTTDSDYRIDQDENISLMVRLKQQDSLVDSAGVDSEGKKWTYIELPIYVPARHRVQVSLHLRAVRMQHLPEPTLGATPEDLKQYHECTSSESSGPFGLMSKSHSRHVPFLMPRSDSPACAAPASRV